MQLHPLTNKESAHCNIETTPLQNAIILSSIIGSILSSYDYKIASDRKKPVNNLRGRLRKFMYKQARKTNQEDFLLAIKIGDRVWQKSINHFVAQKLKIDTVSTIIRLYDLYAEELSKYTSIYEKQMEAFAFNSNAHKHNTEQNSYMVADYILDELSVFTGKKRKKLNLLKAKN